VSKTFDPSFVTDRHALQWGIKNSKWKEILFFYSAVQKDTRGHGENVTCFSKDLLALFLAFIVHLCTSHLSQQLESL